MSGAVEDFQKRAERFEDLSRWVTDETVNGAVLDMLVSRPSLGVVLDAGGGTGYLSDYLSRRMHVDSLALVDASEAMVDRARTRMPREHFEVTMIEDFCQPTNVHAKHVQARLKVHIITGAQKRLLTWLTLI